ncbi:MAG: ABC transporter permease [Calditrichia bacterium]
MRKREVNEQTHRRMNRSDTHSTLRWSDYLNRFGPLLGLLLVYLLFAFIAPPSFSSIRNLETIARQTAIVGIAALGMTLVIISAGIDLSVGSIVALTTVIIAWALQNGWSPLMAALMGIGVATLCGLLNGAIITRLKVVPFIVTLGTLLFLRGVAKGIAGEQKIDAPYTALNELLASLPANQNWMVVSPGVWMLIFLAFLVAALLKFTRLGRHIFAVGSNEKTARLCGINTDRVKIIVYTFSALLTGIAGLMQFSRLTVGDPTVAVGLELDVIAAVVIGGGSLSGGEGSVLGTVIGAFIMTVIRSGCSQMGLPNWVQEILTGGIIVLAVALDRLRHRRLEDA